MPPIEQRHRLSSRSLRCFTVLLSSNKTLVSCRPDPDPDLRLELGQSSFRPRSSSTTETLTSFVEHKKWTSDCCARTAPFAPSLLRPEPIFRLGPKRRTVAFLRQPKIVALSSSSSSLLSTGFNLIGICRRLSRPFDYTHHLGISNACLLDKAHLGLFISTIRRCSPVWTDLDVSPKIFFCVRRRPRQVSRSLQRASMLSS